MGKDVMFLEPIFTTDDRFTVILRSLLKKSKTNKAMARQLKQKDWFMLI